MKFEFISGCISKSKDSRLREVTLAGPGDDTSVVLFRTLSTREVERAIRMVRHLKHMTDDAQLGEPGWFRLQKRKL